MRILSLDGGGIRGVLTARLLERIEKACPGFLDSVDLIAGTSTGGIQALKLAQGGTPAELTALYQSKGERIFKSRDFLDVIPNSVRAVLLTLALCSAGVLLALGFKVQALGTLLVFVGVIAALHAASKLDEFWRSNFSEKDLEAVLKEELGSDTTLRDLRKYVLIPTFDMRNWGPKFFDNLPGNDGDLDQRLWEVARCTSAAPTYWPSHQWCWDGGLYANNPSDSAVATCVRYLRKKHLVEDADLNDKDELLCLQEKLEGVVGEVALEEVAALVATIRSLGKITVLSLGTGEVPHQPPAKPVFDAGILDVIPMLLNVVMDGAVKASTFKSSQGLNGRHVRIQPQLPSVIDLADMSAVPDLLQIADLTDLEPAVRLVREVWLSQKDVT